jgi:hypothetical protein
MLVIKLCYLRHEDPESKGLNTSKQGPIDLSSIYVLYPPHSFFPLSILPIDVKTRNNKIGWCRKPEIAPLLSRAIYPIAGNQFKTE